MSDARTGERVDASLMQPTGTAARSGGLEVHQIYRDGALVATLMAVDQGDTYTVVAEVFERTGETVKRRPYSFADADAAQSFLAEAVTSFTYLGCEIRRL
jgi:hypothetical protein